MFSRDTNTHIRPNLTIDMARENRLQLCACRQLQAIQGRCTQECLAGNSRPQCAVRGIDDIVRAQQHVHGAAYRPGVGPIAAQLTQFGLHRFWAAQLTANEIALADETRDKRCQGFVIQVVGRIPLFQATFLEHANVVADREGFFLVVSHQNRAGATGLEDVAYFMAELAAQFAIKVGEGFVEQQQLRFRRQGTGQCDTLLLTS
ncbi:hypothetical protein D3C80_568480 [compost metagenome]